MHGKLFIGGQWLAAQDEATIPVIAPADGLQFTSIARGRAHEVDLAVGAARAALDGAWGRCTAAERGRSNVANCISTWPLSLRRLLTITAT
jgi:aldehyde dehydrogenase (NAD+)